MGRRSGRVSYSFWYICVCTERTENSRDFTGRNIANSKGPVKVLTYIYTYIHSYLQLGLRSYLPDLPTYLGRHLGRHIYIYIRMGGKTR